MKGVGGVLVSVEGKDVMQLISQVNEKKIQVVLQNVLYVPEAPNNLLSVTWLDEIGGCAVMGEGYVRLYDKNKMLILVGHKIEQMYLLDAVAQQVESKEMVLLMWMDWH